MNRIFDDDEFIDIELSYRLGCGICDITVS